MLDRKASSRERGGQQRSFRNRCYANWKGRSVRSAHPTQQTAVDGELVDAPTLDIEVLPGAIKLVVPLPNTEHPWSNQ